MRFAVLSWVFAVFISSPAFSDDRYYEIPVVNGVPVDGCVRFQADCGQPAADQFCQTQNFARASQWAWAYDLRTWNIGSNRFCDRAADNIRCGGLRTVTCTGGASASSAPQQPQQPYQPQQPQGSWAGQYDGGAWGNVTITGGPATYQGTYTGGAGGTFHFPSDNSLGRWSGGGRSGNLRVTLQPDGSLHVGYNTDGGGADGGVVWRRR